MLTGTAKNCGLRTEAKYVVETPAIQDLPFVSHNDLTGLNTWSLYTVEVGSTSNFTSVATDWPVDSFTSRVLEHKFELSINPYGAIVIPVDAGDMLPPLISRVRSTSAVRDPNNSNQATIQFMLNVYVRQPNTLVPADLDGTGVATDATKLLQLHTATMNTIVPAATLTGATGWTATCQTLTVVAANTDITTGSQIACTRDNCGLIKQTQLPSYITANFNPTTMNLDYYWMPYDMTVQCTVTSSTATPATSALAVPSTTISIDYAIADKDRVITDIQVGSRPFITFNTYFTLPALTQKQQAFPLVGRVVELQESTIDNTVATLSEIIYNNENNDVASKHRFAYSQALAFKVQLEDMATRAQWQLRPALALLTAFNDGGSSPSVGTQSDIVSTYTAFGGSKKLDVDFCGLNRADLVAAFAFVDGAGAGAIDGLSTPVITNGQIADLGRWGNMEQGLTSGLNSRLAQLIQANAYSTVNVFQGNIFSTAANTGTDAGQARVFNVPDATGGFAIPLRNRLRVNGQIGTYSIKFCALVEVAPYNATARGSWYPLYPTKAAALADTLAVNGAINDPIEVYGSDFVGGSYSATSSPAAAVKYYLPYNPISSGGKICVPASQMSNAKLSAVSTRVANAVSDAGCAAMIAGTSGIFAGRRLMGLGGRRSLMQAVQMDVASGTTNELVTNYAAVPPMIVFEAEAPAVADTPMGSSDNNVVPSSTDLNSAAPTYNPLPDNTMFRAAATNTPIPTQTPKSFPMFMILIIVLLAMGTMYQGFSFVRTTMGRNK